LKGKPRPGSFQRPKLRSTSLVRSRLQGARCKVSPHPSVGCQCWVSVYGVRSERFPCAYCWRRLDSGIAVTWLHF
jgi:hypothetical protein